MACLLSHLINHSSSWSCRYQQGSLGASQLGLSVSVFFFFPTELKILTEVFFPFKMPSSVHLDSFRCRAIVSLKSKLYYTFIPYSKLSFFLCLQETSRFWLFSARLNIRQNPWSILPLNNRVVHLFTGPIDYLLTAGQCYTIILKLNPVRQWVKKHQFKEFSEICWLQILIPDETQPSLVDPKVPIVCSH